MRESRPYGSVRGALSNERPYRDSLDFIDVCAGACAPTPFVDCTQSGSYYDVAATHYFQQSRFTFGCGKFSEVAGAWGAVAPSRSLPVS